MNKNKSGVITYLVAILMVSIIFVNMDSHRAQAYEVSGFYQYEANDTGVTITKYTGGELTVSMPSKIAGKNVTVIGDRAFEDNDLIEGIIIPKTVTTIGYKAFRDCDSLLEVTIPDSVTTINSGSYNDTFGLCDNLTKVVIGDGVTAINANCFYECPKLQNVTIGNNVKLIDYRAFYNCDSLQSIDIPSSVKALNDSCFYDCDSLKILKLSFGLETIGYSAFKDCDSLMEVTIPDSVTTINSGSYNDTFGLCDNLTKVVIGDGVTAINANCFYECPKLQNVTIGNNVKLIDYRAFYNCDSLQSIDIPSSVKVLNDGCFYDCDNLQILNLSYGLDIIGYSAFMDCDSLLDVTIPESVTTINSGSYNHTFGLCDSLQRLQIPNSVTSIGEYLVYESDNAVIFGYANSTAAKYASDNKLSFQELTSIPAATFSFENSEMLMMVGENAALEYSITPEDTTDAIVWKTSDANIATVDNIGEVTAKSAGSVSIIGATTSGKKASITVIVQEAPKAISFKTAVKTLAVKQTYTQKAILDDGSRTDIRITYKSSNTTVATVNSDGKVTAKKVGKVTITAEIFNGLKTTYEITVKKEPTSVKLTPTKVTLKVKGTYTLKTTISEGSFTSKYTYKSSNTSIATVDSNGKIVAKKKGTVKITVTTHNGKKATCIVTIK